MNEKDYEFLKPGETLHVNNPNWRKEGEPQRFEISSTGAAIYIKPEW